MSNKIDYFSVKIPKEKEPDKYSYIERRADILKLIMEAGHPRAITQTKLAETYKVSQPQIHKDVEAIKDFFGSISDKKTVNMITETVY